jgi:hypothetical protein
MRFPLSRSPRAAVTIGAILVLFLFGGQPVRAAGPFAGFHGRWSGTGTIKPADKPAERIRCNATYRPRGSTEHEIDLHLSCDSDSYRFSLAGQFHADEANRISGDFTESTRGVGGSVVGSASGSRMQIHVESSAFSATMVLNTRGASQSVSIDAQGGGQFVKASITLRRGG